MCHCILLRTISLGICDKGASWHPFWEAFTGDWHLFPTGCMVLVYASKRPAEILLGPAGSPACLTHSCCMQEVKSATPSSAYQALLRHEKAIGEAYASFMAPKSVSSAASPCFWLDMQHHALCTWGFD